MNEVKREPAKSFRATVSVAGNIAEGFKKKSPADKLRFLNISQGSLSESEF